jgi:hypothetical protein
MTRPAWIVVVAVVAVAVVAATLGVVATATNHGSVAPGPRVMLQGQNGKQGNMGPFGQGNGSGFGQRGQVIVRLDRDGWRPLRGLPWLAVGLLIGLGATMLAWQPWKRPALATAGGADAYDGGAPDASQQWAQWHRDVHAAEEMTQQMTAQAAVTEVAEQAPAAETAAAEPADAAPPAGDATA